MSLVLYAPLPLKNGGITTDFMSKSDPPLIQGWVQRLSARAYLQRCNTNLILIYFFTLRRLKLSPARLNPRRASVAGTVTVLRTTEAELPVMEPDKIVDAA
jgi:hypothetical protein